jgi:HK97 family phage portal protein
MGTLRDWWFGTKQATLPPALPTKPALYETVNPAPLVMITSMGDEVTIDLSWLRCATPTRMYETQPYLRSVISFLGRNIAQLGLGVYIRESAEVRERADDSVAAALLHRPNSYTTRYELFDALVCDMALWDRAFWWVQPDSTAPSGWVIHPIPSAWVGDPASGTAAEPEYWYITRPGTPTVEVPAAQVIHFHGWNPTSLVHGVTPVETLKAILEEQVASVVYRAQRWARGARVGTVIQRPVGAPRWSPEAEKRFRSEFDASYTGAEGSSAGGTPILQDGMTLTRVGFSAVEDEFIDANKLALTTVAAVYHVNPTMVGLLDNANYSNVREFRRMLYGDTLGPWLAMIEDRINTFLLPLLGEPSNEYVEFNIAEKLQGSFEEQAAVAATAVGGPYMTRNEYRARQNLPPIDGGDELIVPLNVTAGGQPSSQTPLAAPIRLSDGLVQVIEPAYRTTTNALVRASTGPVLGKLKASERQVNATAAVLRRFYKHQGASVLSQMPKAGRARRKADGEEDEWWDEDRWNEALTKQLYAVAMKVNADLGGQQIDELGLPDPFDPEGNAEYLQAVMATRAASINSTTKAQLDDVLQRAADGEEDAPTPADVFETAMGDRSITGAQTIMTTVAGIAMEEAGRQAEVQTGGQATKTWVVNSTNSRHPEMDGETVPLNEDFSNGAAWPGDSVLGPDETAGCTCDLVISMS